MLDGGAMFGAVPKVLWSKKCSVDENNCMELVNNPLLVQTRNANLIIDTGLGNKLTEKQLKIFRVTRQWAVTEELPRFGLSPEDIDLVVFTHGDFDHAGGAVMQVETGELVPAFPQARYIIQKKEWEDICSPIERTKHTYFAHNFAALADRGLLEPVDGDVDLLPEIKVRHSGGHTRGHQIVEISGKRGRAVHLGDLFATHYHSSPLWVMAYDNFPLEVIERKKRFFADYGKDCWFTFYHDPGMRACRLDANYQIMDSM